MALAVLNHVGASGSDEVFEIEIGENRFYRFLVGTEPNEDGQWGESLSDVAWEGPVEGPVAESRRGRERVRLPGRVFDRDNRFVQLVSARERDGTGQAVSDVRGVRTRTGARPREDWGNADFTLQPPARDIVRIRRDAQDAVRPPGPRGITYQTEAIAMTRPASRLVAPPSSAYSMTVLSPGPHRPRLTRMHISEAKSIGAIISAIGSLAPQVIGALQGLAPAIGQLAPTINQLAPAIGNLISGDGRTAVPGGSARPASGGSPSDVEMQRMLVDLIRQAIQAIPRTPVATPAAPAPAESQSLVSRARSIGRSAPRVEQAVPASQAFVAPALLAALPALAPILQSVLNPQTVQSVINAPNQHMGTIINGIKDFMKLGIQSAEQDLNHLRQLTPGHEDPELTALLASMSLGLMQGGREEPRYKRVSSVKLSIADAPPVDIQGVEAAAYRIGRDWGIELTLDTPRTIPDGQVRIFVKDAETLEIVVKGKGPKADIQSGPLPQPIAIPASATENLDPGRRYLLCVHVVWENSKGKPRGTSIQQEVVALGGTSFERVELQGEVMALADPVADRAVWHQIWTGDFDRDRQSYAFDVTYRLGVGSGSGSTDRTPTRLRVDGENGPQVKGRLSTATTIPLSALLSIREDLMPDATPIAQETESVLRSTAFAKRMTMAARTRLEIRGLAGKKGAIWAYLGVKLGKITLNRVDGVDDLGRVTGIAEEELEFPIPVTINFAGYRTSGRDREETPPGEGLTEAPEMLNGMKKVFERQATLAPEATVAMARGASSPAARRRTARAQSVRRTRRLARAT